MRSIIAWLTRNLLCCHRNTDGCCYHYTIVPTNVSRCNPQGLNPRLLCAVNSPQDPFTNITVNWYRSDTENSAGINGEQIDNVTEKYVITSTQISDRNNENSTRDGINLHYFRLQIINFTASDGGYYWCQIMLNKTCLQPSPYGHIDINTSLPNGCTDAEYNVKYDLEESSYLCGNVLSFCGTENFNRKKMPQNSTCFSPNTFYGVSGSLLFIIVLLLLVISLFCASYCSNRRKTAVSYSINGKCAWTSDKTITIILMSIANLKRAAIFYCTSSCILSAFLLKMN